MPKRKPIDYTPQFGTGVFRPKPEVESDLATSGAIESGQSPEDNSPVLDIPQPQGENKQSSNGRKQANRQTGKSINALQTKQDKFEQKGTPLLTPHADAQKRPVKPRHGFDIYWDQYEALVKWSNDEKLQGGTGSMSAMVREALDDYIAKRKNQ